MCMSCQNFLDDVMPHYMKKKGVRSCNLFGAENVECHLVKTLSGLHERTIYSVDWSTVNGFLATAGADNRINILSAMDSKGTDESQRKDVETAVQVQQLQAHKQDINCVRWRPQDSKREEFGAMLASASDDGTIILWKYS